MPTSGLLEVEHSPWAGYDDGKKVRDRHEQQHRVRRGLDAWAETERRCHCTVGCLLRRKNKGAFLSKHSKRLFHSRNYFLRKYSIVFVRLRYLLKICERDGGRQVDVFPDTIY